jgi:LAGLIDADG-like domain
MCNILCMKQELTINLIDDYQANMSWIDMQQKYDRCSKSIRNILNNNNIPKRLKAKQPERKIKEFNKYKVNPNTFINISIPESSYILGFMWADGYVNIKKGQCPIVIASTYPDSEEIYTIINKTGNWNYFRYENKSHKTWKDKVSITTNNFPLAQFLINNDYNAKSHESADKILSLIPENLKHYWFRGLFDGDGWIYHKNRAIQIGIASTYEQNWHYLERLCNELNVKYTIKKYISPKGYKSSCIRITGKLNCLKFLNYIYKNAENDKIFLNRKYQKYLNLIKYIERMNEFHNRRNINALERNKETASNTKIIKLVAQSEFASESWI